MASVTRRPAKRAERREAVEARVFAAVEKLLGEGLTYTEISVQQIITEAGVARSTFYGYFHDKSDLLQRLATTLRESFFLSAASWDPAEGLPGLVRVFEEILRRHREHLPLLAAITETAAYDPAVRSFYNADLDAFEARVTQDLRELQAQGSTDPAIDPVATSRVVVWGGEQAIAHHMSTDDGSGDAAFAAQMAALWWYGAYHRLPGGE
jgi:AcrR family transcriptional regulator